jgi:hypothetical protein
VLGYLRTEKGKRLLFLANFSERSQEIQSSALKLTGLAVSTQDLTSGSTLLTQNGEIQLKEYQFVCLSVT